MPLSSAPRCRWTRARVVGFVLAVVLVTASCLPATVAGPSGPAPYLAPWVVTPPEVADRMLELATVTKDDVVYDLGSGDGRIVIRAAKRFGARAVGVEIDPKLVALSERTAQRAGVEHLVTFRRDDALAVDLSPATVVTLYIGAEGNHRLRPRLRSQLRPGSRVVSHRFDMEDWEPDVVERVQSLSGEQHVLYLWRIP